MTIATRNGVRSKRKKILFLIPSMGAGGAERVFLMILAHLDRGRFEPHLGVLQGKGQYVSDVPTDVPIHRLEIARVRYALPAIVRLVWKLKPHTVLSTLGYLNLTLILARCFLPKTARLVVREAAVPSATLEGETRHPMFWKWLYRFLYRRADTVVCLSDSMVADLAGPFKVPREKLVRVYNPVDIERVRQLAEAGPSPYTGSGPNILGAGRLTRQKGFDVLLQAMPSILERLPGAKLTILGTGPQREQLVRQAQRLGVSDAVRFLGFQENPWIYLKHADLFALPSRYEGTPNIVLEALAVGTRVVASDCPGALREIGDCDGLMVLVPPEDPKALSAAMEAVYKTPKRDRQSAELKRALIKFDLHRIVGEYSDLFE